MDKSYNAKVDIKILGGLPVSVLLWFRDASEPGEVGPVIEDWEVVSRKGRPFGKWIYERIDATKGEKDRILDQCYEEYDKLVDDWNEP